MTTRALSLLDLSSPSLVLDIGCGSGLSGEILTSSDPSHTWIGFDISSSMLSVARFERDVDGDLMLADAGQGVPFRAGTFDAAISISAIQWLCNAESAAESEQPERRLKRFFGGLYVSLRRGARAVLQFYPRDQQQREMISKAAIAAGFGAGLLEDDEGTKSAKTFLVLTVGGEDVRNVIEGMADVDVEQRAKRDKGGKAARKMAAGEVKGSKAWIMRKKDQMERKGKVVKSSSKYTGRKRRTAF